jgi:hypothetical protein
MADENGASADQYRRRDVFTGSVIVRLKPDVARRVTGDLSDAPTDDDLRPLRSLLDEFAIKDSRPAARRVKREQILEWERRAAGTRLAPLHSLTAYWRLDLREQPERMPQLVERLLRLPAVDDAYIETAVEPAVVQPADDPMFGNDQKYLQAAPVGIDAQWAWLQPSGDGSDVNVADVEAGWNRNHEDLAGQSITIIGDNHAPQSTAPPGVLSDPAFNDWTHGTAVLGILAARDNAIGVIGAAPGVKHIYAASVWEAATGTPGHVVDALTSVMQVLVPGDVVLLELQTARGNVTGFPDNHPIEIKPLERDAIRLAVANNLVVIEAAGNGATDLDQYVVRDRNGNPILDSAGRIQRPLNRNDPTFQESGAIMVAAGTSTVPHQWSNPSNYGSRIDCYAWNDSIGTCGFGVMSLFEPNANKWYRNDFGGTSGASAIVAGAAVLLQSMHVGAKGAFIPPATMRTLLSDPNRNTKADPSAPARPIGVMPNLRGVSISLGLGPDVYLRDAVGDDGAVPSMGAVSLSPDIIAWPTAVANAAAQFGENSVNRDKDDLTGPLAPNKDAFIYLRMSNRGSVDAPNVVGRIWWSEPGTNLTNPANWQLIGQTSPITVPAGDVLTVAGPVTWPAARVPPAGHYCLVAMLDCPRDPAPDLGAAIANFEALVRDANNITWRNFDVVSTLWQQGRWRSYEFFIAGAYARALPFDLEIMQDLLDATRIALEVPFELAELIARRNDVEVIADQAGQSAKIALPGQREFRLRDIPLPANARYPARVHVSAPEGTRSDQGTLAIRQLHDGLELGRMTWRFATARTETGNRTTA